jgi:hypothetical protein
MIVPDNKMAIPKIEKVKIERDITHARGISWGRSTSTIEGAGPEPAQSTDVNRGAPVAECT